MVESVDGCGRQTTKNAAAHAHPCANCGYMGCKSPVGIALVALFFVVILWVCFPGPGLAPAGDSLFLRVQEKEAKEARPCCPYPLRFAAGQPAVLGRGAVPRNSLRATRCVQTDAASQITKRVCPAAHAPAPRPALLGTARRGLKTTRAIAALGLGRAARSACALGAERSDGPCRPYPLSGCAWGEAVVGWHARSRACFVN